MIKISNYINPTLVTFPEPTTRDEAIIALVDAAHGINKIEDKKEFFQAIVDREEIVSTGIGMGVAIPHAKLSTLDDFFIVFGIFKQGVDWNALDGAPVRIVFLIGGPDDKQTEYLQILSSLTVAIKDEERRKKMLTMKSASGIVDLFKDF